MSTSIPDIKLLWSRSGDRCAFPGCNVLMTQDSAAATDAFPLGEMAHIVGETKSEKSPRGMEPLSEDQRNAYDNLILLCPNHHTIIDKDEVSFPVGLLHAYKAEHEGWIRERTGLPDAHAEAAVRLYGRLVDYASVELFERWETISGGALFVRPRWLVADLNRVEAFREQILRAPFPGRNGELEAALKRLSLVLSTAAAHFMVHAEEDDRNPEIMTEVRFYKIDHWDEVLYKRLADEYDAWIDRGYELMKEATKAANWVCDAVRRDLNPDFRLETGYLLASSGDDLSWSKTLYAYDDAERAAATADPAHSLERAQTGLEQWREGLSQRS